MKNKQNGKRDMAKRTSVSQKKINRDVYKIWEGVKWNILNQMVQMSEFRIFVRKGFKRNLNKEIQKGLIKNLG